MSKVLVTESHLEDIADAIREKLWVQTTYRPGDMAAAIESIDSGYPEPTGTLPITANGTVNVKDYASANVNVPNSYAAEDEGKVVSSGALVAQTSRSVTQNGTYDTTENNEVVVNVSGGSSTLVAKNITQNGTYNPVDDQADGYSQVVVNVQGGGTSDEILYNHDFTLNTTGRATWDATNSGTSASSRTNIIDGWNIMQCTAEIVSGGLKIVPKKAYAYLTCQIPPYWFNGKRITLKVTVNGVEYSQTGTFYASGASINLNTPFGSLNCYGYSASDNVFTITFINQIDQEFIVSTASMKLATT